MSERLAIFAEGLFAKHSGKTAHGVIRYGNRDVVAVIDSTCAGRTANEVEPFALHPAPIVATLDEAIEYGAESLLIGVAPTGRQARSRMAANAYSSDKGWALARGRPAHPAPGRSRAERRS